MNQTVLINLLIIALVAIGILTSGNPLFILALLMLMPLPYGLAQQNQSADDEDESQPMGFTQNVK
jgi:hypothetical protein